MSEEEMEKAFEKARTELAAATAEMLRFVAAIRSPEECAECCAELAMARKNQRAGR